MKAVFEFMGIAYTEEDLYAHVLAMEQIMSTGGGWQDQVGGITSGLKYITSMPGLQQQLQVAHIELSPQTKKELDERFVLIYTGRGVWREIFFVMWWDAMWVMNRIVCLRWRRSRKQQH